LRAAATFEAVSGDFETIFEAAQPSFKNNYMYMAGYTDEHAFDRDLKVRMPLGDLVTRITRRVLPGIAEFDELTRRQLLSRRNHELVRMTSRWVALVMAT
jgi:hypothetical protein